MKPDELYHYGVKYRSGRYPYGSGEVPFQHDSDFLKNVKTLRSKGLSDTEIAKQLNISTTELRRRYSIDKDAAKAALDSDILRLKDLGWSNTAIAEKFGISEGSVRNRLKPVTQERAKITNNVADVLKDNLKDQLYLNVGAGSETLLGVSRTKLDTAVRKLQDEGYDVQNIKIPQPNDRDKFTTIKVLAPAGTTQKDIYNNLDKIGIIGGFYTNDGGRTMLGIEPPKSVDPSRIKIKYTEEGGSAKDGVIELRRGVEDLSLGNANYAQVRIAVNGTHYIKGMAMYSDNLPDGVDILFNTNKHEGTPMLGPKDNSVFKPLKSDPDNPFGTTLRFEGGRIVGQRHYQDKNGKDELSPINIVRQEGDWETWSKTLSSQFLSKQPISLIRKQLDISYAKKETELAEIMRVTTPEVKKSLLMSFADDCDASASHLKAAALPRQSSKVILPLTSLKDNEVYAPGYRDGEQVALIRHPHGGTFELPILTVTTKHKEGDKVIGRTAIDAIGINPTVAARLSGADFDGDTVIVIPTSGQTIKSTPTLEGLKDFDPKERYPKYDGMKVMNNTQNEMGRISNLITDMTLKGATEAELARAVRHSMVVIDAEKHELNYKQSEIDNGIKSLKTYYQGAPNAGAATLISRANAEQRVDHRKTTINPETGEKEYEYTGKTYNKKVVDKETGEVSWVKQKSQMMSTQMAERKDAFELSTGTSVENEYAAYANKLKAMANNARKEALAQPSTKVSPSAKEAYASEVASLNSKLNVAIKNKPYEQQAQILAKIIIDSKKYDNPSMDKDEFKKMKNQALIEARARTGSNRKSVMIEPTAKEWEAVKAGALSSSKISQILSNSNPETIKRLSTPRESLELSNAQKARIKSLERNGASLSEIADALGVSTSTVSKYIK